MEKFAATSCVLPLTAEKTNAPAAIFGSGSFNTQGFSLFRISLGLILLYSLIFNIIPYYDFYFGVNGFLTAQERQSNVIWSLLSYTDNPIFTALFFIVYTIAIFSFLLGCRTRLASFVLFVCYTSINDRFPPAVSGEEILMCLLLFWASFLPIDRYWSIDAALRDQSDRRTKWPNIPLLAIKIQVGLLYLSSGLFKLTSDQWLSGEALKRVILDQYFSTKNAFDLLHSMPDEWAKWLCFSIFSFQISFSLFVYFPFYNKFFRAFALAGAAVMHAAFIFLLQVHLFPYMCFAYLMILIPDPWIDSLFKKRRERLGNIKIFYDPDCNFCRSISLIFREFCLPSTVAVRPASEDATAHDLLLKNNSWVIFGHDGKIYMKWDAVSYVLKQSPIFYIFGYLSGLGFLKKSTASLYDYIGRHRYKLGKIFGFILRPRAETCPDIVGQLICGFLMALSLTFAVLTLPQSKIVPPAKLDIAVHQLGIAQKWDLFAPRIASDQFILSIYGADKNYVYQNLGEYLDRQFTISDGYFTFPNHRILRIYREIFRIDNPRHRMGLARYLCATSARSNNPAERIFMNLSSTLNPLVNGKLDTIHVEYACSDILNKDTQ